MQQFINFCVFRRILQIKIFLVHSVSRIDYLVVVSYLPVNLINSCFTSNKISLRNVEHRHIRQFIVFPAFFQNAHINT